MLRSSLSDYSDAYILVKRTATFPNTGTAAALNNRKKQVIWCKNCAPFTDCISKISNSETDYAKEIYVVMSMYKLTECSDNYSKTFGNLWQ